MIIESEINKKWRIKNTYLEVGERNLLRSEGVRLGHEVELLREAGLEPVRWGRLQRLLVACAPEGWRHLGELPDDTQEAHMAAVRHSVIECGVVLQEELEEGVVVEVLLPPALRVVPTVL